MDNDHRDYLKTSYPRWFVILFIFCGIFTLLLSVFYIFWAAHDGLSAKEFWRSAIFLGLILGAFWFFGKVLLYSVTATEDGLETANPFGSSKSFLWDEIVEVRRPRFGIPYDFTYIISKKRDKLILIRSMKNYKELIQVIKSKAPNLNKCQM